MSTSVPAPTTPQVHPVPVRALVISLGALSVAAAGAFVFPAALVEYRFLTWLLALIPAFLLCYYRQWTRLMIALAAGMVVLSSGYVAGVVLGANLPEWPFFGFVIAAYIGIALGAGWFAEVRVAVDRQKAAERELRQAFLDLRKSHNDLQLAQWKLIETEKLEAVGQLAAGVAHEVKNPLMTLITGVQILSQQVPTENRDVQTLLDDMREAVKRADAVITGLLDFSAPRELDPTPEDLNTVVERSASMVKHEVIRAHVTLDLDLGADLPMLPIDVFKLQQVLVNIFTNAAHATPAGGTITARTYRKGVQLVSDAATGDAAGSFTTGDEVVVLEVDDTGSGIAEDKLGKLFDPFFTTKPPGKGTGLGLAVSRQIIEMHGARMDIGNRPEGGARVTIVFDVPTEGG